MYECAVHILKRLLIESEFTEKEDMKEKAYVERFIKRMEGNI